jgi:hypothetical protein
MSIQFLPEYFTQQRPSKSEQIFQQLEPVGKSLGKSLQNTIQGYYDQQKEDRQAELGGRLRKQQAIGLAQAYKHPEWSEALGNFEAPQQIDLAKQLSESSPASMVLSKLINGGRFEAPEPVQQPAPTAQSIAANQAAAQRMGMANQEPGQIPGMPEYAQPGQQGPLPQYQPAMGQEEPAATPAEVVPPEPTKGQGNGLDLASFQGKRLGDMSIEQLDALKDGQPAQVQKQLEDAYNRQRLRGAKEILLLQKETLTLIEKNFNGIRINQKEKS